MPGERYVYRFRAEQLGTFWYHSHQVSSKQVRRGLYGAFVIEPRASRGRSTSTSRWSRTTSPAGRPWARTTGSSDGRRRPGTRVRLRLVNTNSFAGTVPPRRDALPRAIDGTDVNGRRRCEREGDARGRRGDATTSSSQCRRGSRSARRRRKLDGAHAQGRDWRDSLERALGADFDPPARPAETTLLGRHHRFDRTFELEIGKKRIGLPERATGLPLVGQRQALPGDADVHGLRGDLVKMRIVNDTGIVHPMHLHGHHVLVLSRDGKPTTGARGGWTPSTCGPRGVRGRVPRRQPGDLDGPLPQPPAARDGLTMHVTYEGVDDAVPARRRPREPPGVTGLHGGRRRGHWLGSALPLPHRQGEDRAEDQERVDRDAARR